MCEFEQDSQMQRSTYLILWLSPATTCCVLPPGRGMKGRLFSHLQNTVVRYVIMLGTLEGRLWLKEKLEPASFVIWALFHFCEPGKPPSVLTAQGASPATDWKLSLPPSSALSCPPTPTHPCSQGPSFFFLIVNLGGGLIFFFIYFY